MDFITLPENKPVTIRFLKPRTPIHRAYTIVPESVARALACKPVCFICQYFFLRDAVLIGLLNAAG